VALVRRFEDLEAWREARRLANHVYLLTRAGRCAGDRSLVSQLRRAAISTVTNVAEGFGSGTKAEFCRFLRYAIRSAAEVQGCLYVALDQEYVSREQFDTIYRSAERLKSLSSALLRRLKQPAAKRHPEPDRVAESSPTWRRAPRARIRFRGGASQVSTSARQHVSTTSTEV
jgi:four helix bundle protein